jgi:hypothetical protein
MPRGSGAFDFVPQSLADGTSDAEGGQNIRNGTIQIGEPILSGFTEGKVVPFLTGIGYSGVQVIPSRAYARMYFTGKNADQKVSGLMSVAYATVSGVSHGRQTRNVQVPQSTSTSSTDELPAPAAGAAPSGTTARWRRLAGGAQGTTPVAGNARGGECGAATASRSTKTC